MGQSHGRINIERRSKTESQILDSKLPEPEVTEREVALLKEMWLKLSKDIAKVGVVTFIDLFETHPDVQDVFMAFRSKDKSELEYDKVLRAHALRVMGTVDKCINRLNNREKLQEIMTELGKRHQNYSVKLKFVDLMGPQFISSIKPHLENMWTEEHERAWENLFRLMCFHMKQGICRI